MFWFCKISKWSSYKNWNIYRCVRLLLECKNWNIYRCVRVLLEYKVIVLIHMDTTLTRVRVMVLLECRNVIILIHMDTTLIRVLNRWVKILVSLNTWEVDGDLNINWLVLPWFTYEVCDFAIMDLVNHHAYQRIWSFLWFNLVGAWHIWSWVEWSKL